MKLRALLVLVVLTACHKADPVAVPEDAGDVPSVVITKDPFDDARLEASLKRLEQQRIEEAVAAGKTPEPRPAPLDVPRALDGTDNLRAEAGEAAVIASANALAARLHKDGPATHETDLQAFIALPRSREPVRVAISDLLVAAARECLARLDISKAAQYARLAREIHESNSGAYRVLGELEYQQSNYEAAFQLYETGLLRNPNDTELRELYERQKKDAMVTTLDRKSSAHFVVSFEGGSDDEAAQLTLDSLEQAYKDVGALFDVYPDDKVSVVLYPNRTFDAEHRHPAWAAGSYDGKVRIGVAGALGQTRIFRGTLYHEYAHAVFHRATGDARCPAWLNEGLAQLAAEKAGNETAALMCSAGHMFPLHNLEKSFGLLDVRQAHFAYLEARHAAERLVAKHSLESIREMLSLVKKSRDFDGAFDSAMGETVTSFVSGFDSEPSAPP